MVAKHIVSILTSLLLVQHACCFPHFWIYPEHSGYAKVHAKAPACFDQPTDKWGEHPSPVSDPTATYTMLLNAKPVSKVCPGQAYQLKMTFQQARMAMLTSKGINFTKPYAGKDAEFDARDVDCPGRLFLDPSINEAITRKQTEFVVDLVIACDAPAKVEVRTSSSALAEDFFRMSSASFRLDKSCASQTCGAGVPATTAASPKAPSAPTTSPATKSRPITTPSPTVSCKFPLKLATQCTKSELGYQCGSDMSRSLPGMKVHWQVGGCVPKNPCTEFYKQMNTQLVVNGDYLHMAVEMETTGYVGIAFASSIKSMIDADAVIGWSALDSTPVVNSYPLTTHGVRASTAYTSDDQFLSHSSVVTTNGVTTLCFSRPLSHPTARFSAVMDPVAPLKLIYAQGGDNTRALVNHVREGGFELNLGTAAAVKPSRDFSPEKHGALMTIAWAFLIPLAIMVSRRRAALADRQIGGVDTWFQIHRFTNVCGIALFIAGLVIAYTKLDIEGGGGIKKAHKYLAIALIVSTGCQALLGIIRVGKTHSLRPTWELAHYSLGYTTAAAALSNIFIGIQVYKDKTGYSMTPWIVACCVLVGSVVLLDCILWRMFGGKKEESGGVLFAGPTSTNKEHAQNGGMHATSGTSRV